ncbi:type I-E CRISPR-associated protein Cse1/CasA [Actinokineospora inagensis]|uniref:type I-E CRISPR-associated protein Cse1/CasA n=1 Tax=Actinokineospora inagensis TaxID=103730 RepID=UPI0003FF0801|nr:type I-E CRISPR-associated protein Cse1/CasA [Actinokineospora inagensis]
MSKSDPFNLLDEDWISVRWDDGVVRDVSVRTALAEAHQILNLVGDVPTQVFALTRLLLAVLHRATDGPRDEDDWDDLWNAETLPDVTSYLDKYRDRWDLFHPDTPFFQVAGLHTAKGEMSDLSKLIADVPNGQPFFTNRIGGRLRLSPAEAARWLVHCHAYDPSGIKSGAVGDPLAKNGKGYPIGVGWSGNLGGILAEGSTLRETLVLNLVPRTLLELTEDDPPPWERDQLDPEWGERPPTGPVDLFTWQSRRIRLHRDGDWITGVLICNGDKLGPQNKHIYEVHTGWRRSEAQEKKRRDGLVYMPLQHNPERSTWRGLQSMLPEAKTESTRNRMASRGVEWLQRAIYNRSLPVDHPIALRTTGISYGSNQSVISEVVDDRLNIRAVLLAQDAIELHRTVKESIAAAEDTAAAVGKFAQDLATAAGSREPDGPRKRGAESTYAALDPKFRTWLAALGPSSDPAEEAVAWQHIARAVARTLADSLFKASPMRAWVGTTINDRLITSTHARRWFDMALDKALPRLRQDPPAPEGTS